MQPMGLALEVGEEAGQNSPTDTCLVLPDSVSSSAGGPTTAGRA